MNSIYIISGEEIVVGHDWRGRSYRDVALDFIRINKARPGNHVAAVSEVSRCFCYHIVRDGLEYLGVASTETDAVAALDLLSLIHDILNEYLPKYDAAAVRDNLDVVTELLHELIDDGAPLTTYPNALKDIVLSPTILDRLISATGLQKYEAAADLCDAANVPWRRTKVKYTNNEIFVDVVEDVRGIVERHGKFVHTDIRGRLKCAVKLSGMPKVTLALKPWDRTTLHSLHPCVERDGVGDGNLNFTPPDGQFTLMSYQCQLATTSTNPVPFSVQKLPGKGDDSLTIALTTRRGTPDSITIEVPLPGECADVRAQSSCGDVRIDRIGGSGSGVVSKVVIVWTATNLTKSPSRQTLTLTNLQDAQSVYTYARVSKTTTTAGTSASGVKIDSLKMTRVGDWKPFKGVKYMTSYSDLVFR